MDPITLIGLIGSGASGLGICATIAEWWSSWRGAKKRSKKQATIRDYREWLQRNRHAEMLAALDASGETQERVAELIKSLHAHTNKQNEAILYELRRQKERMDALPRLIRENFGDELAEQFALQSEWMRRLPEQKQSEEDAEYELRYREFVAETLDEVELFGVDLTQEAKAHKLSVAYISLNLGTSGESGTSGLTSAVDVLDTLNPDSGRLLIRGIAGSGKSTLLRWVGIQAANNNVPLFTSARAIRAFGWLKGGSEQIGGFSELSKLVNRYMHTAELGLGGQGAAYDFMFAVSWAARVPLLIRIRDCKQGKFPALEQYPLQVAGELGKPPDDWTRRVLETGRGLVLIDGIDETAPSYRPQVRAQIKRLTQAYKDTYFVLSTRPGAVDENWLADLGFREAEIAPLTGEDRDEFVEKWHAAVRAELEKRVSVSNPSAELERQIKETHALAIELKDELRENLAIARLATTPLLAAMICALHRDRQQKLPKSQYELVNALCELLLWRREYEQKDLDLSEFPEAYRELTYAQRRSILQHLAEYMVSENLSAIEMNLATKKIGESLKTIPGRRVKDAPEVRTGLVERSGMLVEKKAGALDFIHNTFKEFLAARQFVQGERYQLMADKATNADWDNVLMFAAATPENDRFASTLIERVLPDERWDRKKERRRKPTERDVAMHRRRFMAVRLRAVAQRLDDAVDSRVRQLERRVFPPLTLSDAAALAAVGAGVEHYLRHKSGQAVRKSVNCVRALRLMGTEAAMRELLAYREEADWRVVEELSQAINPLEIPEVVRRLQLEWDRERERQEISVRERITDLGALSGLTNLTSLRLDGTQVSDVSALSGLTNLTALRLSGTQVSDVSALSGLTNLTSLWLDGTQVSDVSALSGLTNLTQLRLSGTQVSDVSALSGLKNLKVYVGPRIPGRVGGG